MLDKQVCVWERERESWIFGFCSCCTAAHRMQKKYAKMHSLMNIYHTELPYSGKHLNVINEQFKMRRMLISSLFAWKLCIHLNRFIDTVFSQLDFIWLPVCRLHLHNYKYAQSHNVYTHWTRSWSSAETCNVCFTRRRFYAMCNFISACEWQ